MARTRCFLPLNTVKEPHWLPFCLYLTNPFPFFRFFSLVIGHGRKMGLVFVFPTLVCLFEFLLCRMGRVSGEIGLILLFRQVVAEDEQNG
jgi:hypothetical protein